VGGAESLEEEESMSDAISCLSKKGWYVVMELVNGLPVWQATLIPSGVDAVTRGMAMMSGTLETATMSPLLAEHWGLETVYGLPAWVKDQEDRLLFGPLEFPLCTLVQPVPSKTERRRGVRLARLRRSVPVGGTLSLTEVTLAFPVNNLWHRKYANSFMRLVGVRGGFFEVAVPGCCIRGQYREPVYRRVK
jgi:hypothetical protein